MESIGVIVIVCKEGLNLLNSNQVKVHFKDRGKSSIEKRFNVVNQEIPNPLDFRDIPGGA